MFGPVSLPLALAGLFVRTVHVLAMAVATGGAVLVWWSLRRDDPLAVAVGYEWLFWAALGTLVATGVGNLGALAPALPGGPWGRTLDLKLGVVVLVLVGSLLRTLSVVRLRADPADGRLDDGSRRFLRRSYAATTLGLLLVVALAEVLAHG